MRRIVFLFILLLTSCYHSKKPVVEIKECVVTQIEERVESTLDVTLKFKVITDCGDTLILKNNKYKLGETIYIQKNYYIQNQ